MKIYHYLSKLPGADKHYAMKFFFVVIPLLLLSVAELVVIFLARNRVIHLPLKPLSIFALISLVVAIFITIYLFNKMVSPLIMAKKALEDYISARVIPQLPTQYKDEAGILLSNIQTTITQLDTLISEKSDMIDLLSHDMRSPVGRIQSLSNLILEDSAENKDLYANYITNECKGLLRMLENILLMLKDDTRAFTYINVNVHRLVSETVNFFDFAASEKHVTIKITVSNTLYINVQPDLFTQAFRNILGNAIKFSPEGKTINIVATQDDEKVSLSIIDEGIGFKSEDIDKLFDRFTTTGRKGTHGESSTGLGLYLSKKIVEKHGAKLIATSDGPNTGATFTFVIYRLVTKKSKGKPIFAG